MNSPSSSKEIAWILGTSAAGKQTFINKAAADQSVAALFGWEGRRVVPVPASLEYIAQSPRDPITAKRDAILTQVPQLLQEADVVLAKWQFVDMQDPHTGVNRVQALVDRLPEAVHRAIVLHAPAEDLGQRLPLKPWWTEYGTDDFTAAELPLVTAAVSQLPANFIISHINSGTNQGYTPFEAVSDVQ